ncbi:MAG: hypothetical protein ACI3ZK_00750 [Candidatus Cryptobacteroides sp.]
MKYKLLVIIGLNLFCCCSKDAQAGNGNSGNMERPDALRFETTDSRLQESFDWACDMAVSYTRGKKYNHPVGLWYEAALPGRGAFCMRDASHQSIGAEILGLSEFNLNMMDKFVSNISDSKDWCSWWEINWQGNPAPADYLNDDEFWYNLNANFDVIQACLRLYKWTGDRTYIDSGDFLEFYSRSLNDYVERWQLSAENIMSRPRYMNVPDNFNEWESFHTCRGLASYVENFRNLTVSADLIASIYAGFSACAEIYFIRGDEQKSIECASAAEQYRLLLENEWWSDSLERYYNFWTSDKEFHKGEGTSYILWFGIAQNPERIQASIKELQSKDWNVETLSYFPVIYCRYGYEKAAYNQIVSLPHRERSSYPEVSYGVVEGIVCGLMGLEPDASSRCLGTLSRFGSSSSDQIALDGISVLGGKVNLQHRGRAYSAMKSFVEEKFVWKASFEGEYDSLLLNGEAVAARQYCGLDGKTYSFIEVEMEYASEAEVCCP